MSTERIITSGDDSSLPVTLKKDGATFTIDPSATVRAALIDPDYSERLTEVVVVDNAASGADWENSLLIVLFASDDTEDVRPGDVLLEIEVDDGGKLTWQVNNIKVRKGMIE